MEGLVQHLSKEKGYMTRFVGFFGAALGYDDTQNKIDLMPHLKLVWL